MEIKTKKRIKIIVDILMYVCLITLMGYHITNNLIHEILRNNYICSIYHT
ncbi:MAG: hypothetical protein IJ217_02770 [Clostridia bacterium]|nr:hypothetical protein [Clostridia bacterium]